MEISEFSISDVLNGLRRNKVKVVLSFVIIMGSAVALSLFLPRKYASEAQLLVRLGRENATVDSTATIGEASRISISQKREFETNSVAAMLRSQPLAERVVDAIGPEVILEEDKEGQSNDAAAQGVQSVLSGIAVAKEWLRSFVPSGTQEIGPRDQAIRKLKQGLRVQPVLETNVVQVSYQSGDPDLAQRVVSNVIENYLEEHVRIHSAPGSHEFLMNHVQRLDQELLNAENKLVAARKETGLISPLEQQSVLVTQLGSLRSELYTLEAALAESQAEVDELTDLLSKIAAGEESSDLLLIGATSEGADGMRTQLYQLQLQADESLRKYSPDHVKARRLRSQLEAAKNLLATQEATLEIHQRKPFLASQSAKAEKLREQIAEVESQLAAMNENEMRISQLQRDVEIRDSTFRKVSEDAEQSKIDHSLELAKITNISVVQPATRNLYAVFPNTRLNLLVALFVAMFVSTGLAMLCEARSIRKKAVGRNGVSVPQMASNDGAGSTVLEKESASEEELSLSKPR